MSKHRSYTLAILALSEVNVTRALDSLKRQSPDIGSAIFQLEKALEYNEFSKNATLKTVEHLEAMNEDIRQAYAEMVEMTEKIMQVMDRKGIN